MTIDAQILVALRSAQSSSVSGAELATQLQMSRAAIWARIEELRSLGYEIEASPHEGYRLIKCPDLLHADDLLARLGGLQKIGRDIRVFRETTSTNDSTERLARDGVAEGVVVFAESQTKGRGRLGRRWSSPAGKGLWFSILLRPKISPQAVTQITIASAVSLRRAIKNVTGLTPEIKWPNDLLLNGLKIAGILTELSSEPDAIKHVILGIGVDVNLTSEDFPEELRTVATSLRIVARRQFDRAALAVEILREFERDYQLLHTDRFEELANEWANACTTLGKIVTIELADRSLHGRVEALDQDGALLLRTEYGRLERILGGIVHSHPD
ncbi:MAG: biotin--[acetyl-CoA-carboxylase] ligase [Verrucomicrobia bacterium]|nr:MAG: biotin--[acetyl-CoA-carboxylase] ligase [Verrucomicrobiota bacterium]MCX6881923.1 biotin--[acetyl-CoA-carboxylase] ligase [Verrucomicrobiota bacterium]